MMLRSNAVRRSAAAPLLLALAGAACAAESPAPKAPPASRVSEDRPAAPRFFFTGSGRLRLRHAHFASTLDVRYRDPDGSYDPRALGAIRRFFRSRQDGKEGNVSLRLIELLGFIQDRFRPTSMTLHSGYRSPTFNAALRAGGTKAAQASLHTEGLAADVAFGGVNLRNLWMDLRDLGTGGAGYYRSGGFLHVDTGKPRFWEETTSRVDENLSAGNARVFARTDFDRYADLEGAVVNLHAVTAFPLRVANAASLVGPRGGTAVRLAAGEGSQADGDCIAIPAYAPAYRLKVTRTDASPGAIGGHDATSRPRLVLSTCEPRLEHTPPEIESNPLELLESR